MGISHESNYTYSKILGGVWRTCPFKRYHDQTAILYNRVLAQEHDESGGPEARCGGNTLDQIVPTV